MPDDRAAVYKPVSCSENTALFLQDMYQNMFQFSTFNRFDQIVIGKHFKCFFIEFFILCHQHNRDIMSFQAHCPYSFQTPALITIQPQKYQIADLVSLCQSFLSLVRYRRSSASGTSVESCLYSFCASFRISSHIAIVITAIAVFSSLMLFLILTFYFQRKTCAICASNCALFFYKLLQFMICFRIIMSYKHQKEYYYV